MINPAKTEGGLIIPHEKLSPEALRGLIEEVVTRDGNDNGYTQATLEQNVAAVLGQLQRKEVVVVYDEIAQTANIVPSRYLPCPLSSNWSWGKVKRPIEFHRYAQFAVDFEDLMRTIEDGGPIVRSGGFEPVINVPMN